MCLRVSLEYLSRTNQGKGTLQKTSTGCSLGPALHGETRLFHSAHYIMRFVLCAKASPASRVHMKCAGLQPACCPQSQAVHLSVRISKRPCLIEKAATPLDWLSIYKLEKVTQRPDTSRVTSSPHSKAYAKGHSCRDHSDRKSGRELPIARCFRRGATQRMTMPATLHICQYLHHSICLRQRRSGVRPLSGALGSRVTP